MILNNAENTVCLVDIKTYGSVLHSPGSRLIILYHKYINRKKERKAVFAPM